MRSPQDLLFSRLNIPIFLSLSSQEKNNNNNKKIWSSLWPSCGLSLTGPHLSFTGGPKPGCSTPDGVSWGQGRRGQSLPSTCYSLLFWWSLGCSWPSGLHVLQACTADSCQAFCPPEHPSFSPQGCSQCVLLPVCTRVWNCPNPGTAPCTWTCWISSSSCGPTYLACLVPLDGIPSFHCISCSTQLVGICKLAEGAFNPIVYVIDIEKHLFQDRTLRDTAHHQPSPRHRTIDQYSHVGSCRFPTFPAWFSTYGNRELLCSNKNILERKKKKISSLRKNSCQFVLLKFRVLTFLRPIFSEITNATRVWSLQPRFPPILTSLINSSSLLSIKSSNASLVGLSNT